MSTVVFTFLLYWIPIYSDMGGRESRIDRNWPEMMLATINWQDPTRACKKSGDICHLGLLFQFLLRCIQSLLETAMERDLGLGGATSRGTTTVSTPFST